MLFDSHNHLQSARFGKPVGDLIAEMKGVGVSGCVVNATLECDWEAVREIANTYSDFVRPAYGVHPWFADTMREGWDLRLRELLVADPRASVGEIGVDRWVSSPSIDVQREVFAKQVALAAELDRVMTVHCLKAWDELFRIMDSSDVWPKRFLMHSFGGSIEVAERLAKRGAWFSFSGYFLQPQKRNVLEVFKRLPKDRILLETDAPDMLPPLVLREFPLSGDANHPANLRAISEVFEKETGGGTLEQIFENSRRFWEM